MPIESRARSQSNLVVRKLSGFSDVVKPFSDLVIPMFWLEYVSSHAHFSISHYIGHAYFVANAHAHYLSHAHFNSLFVLIESSGPAVVHSRLDLLPGRYPTDFPVVFYRFSISGRYDPRLLLRQTT